METLQRTRLLSLAVLTVVFGSGVILGTTWESMRAESGEELVVAAEAPEPAAESTERGERERRPNLYEQVGPLTDVQRAQIDSLVGAHRFEIRGAFREFRRQDDELRADYNEAAGAILQRTREGIKAIMTPAQAIVYDSLLVDYDRRREERRRRDDSESRK